jgi:tripartite-type tricarboxylate transporter receptor subunit TctC
MNRHIGYLAAMVLALIACSAPAQPFPSKPIRLIAPFPAGGSLDAIARAIAQPMTASLGKPVVVENRSGGTGLIGTELVARAPADGYTVLLVGSVFAINAATRPRLQFDALADFAGVARVASNPMLLSVHPSVPAKSLHNLVMLVRSHPGELTYATSGLASPQHLAMEMLKRRAGMDLIHVPFQGGAPATQAILGGHAAISVANVSETAPHVLARKLRALAVTSAERSELLTDVPTIAESGFPDFDMSIWFGVWVPATTPRDVIARLGSEILRAVKTPNVVSSLQKVGLSTAEMNPDEFDSFYRAEIQRYARIVKEANIKLDQ